MGSGVQGGPPVDDFEPLLDSREAAPYLRIHYKTLEAKARLGLVPAMKEGTSAGCFAARSSMNISTIN